MKKFTLLLCLCFVAMLVPQRVWADATLSDGNKTLTITTTAAGQVSGFVTTLNPDKSIITKIVLVGKFNSSDLAAIAQDNGFNQVTTVDMSSAYFYKTYSSSNNYYLYTSGEPTAENPTEGSKAISEGTYQQATVNTSRAWESVSQEAGLAYTGEFKPVNFAEADKDQDYNKSPFDNDDHIRFVATSNYYQMIYSNPVWTKLDSNPGDVQFENVSFSETTENLTDQNNLNYNDGAYIRFVSNATCYKLTGAKTWEAVVFNNLPDNVSFQSVSFNESEREEYTSSYNEDDYIKFQLDDYEYFRKDISQNKLVSIAENEAGDNPITTYNDYFDAKAAYYYPLQDGDVVKVHKCNYYKLAVSNKEWTSDTYNNAVNSNSLTYPSFDESNRNDHLTEYKYGQYIGFATAYNYYRMYHTKTWTSVSSLPEGTTATVITDFSESDRDNHKDGYYNSQYIQFPLTYNYYKMVVTTDITWADASYTNGEQKTVHHIYASTTKRDEDNSVANGEFAVVGGTQYMYKSTGWTTDLTEEYDNTQIVFNKWSNTLITAYLPNYIDVSTCPNSVLSGCTNLTKVYSNGNYVEVAKSGTTATVTAQSAGLFKLLLTATKNDTNYPSGTVFQFNSGSNLNVNDLLVLAEGDGKYYVDLFDVTATSGLCDYQTGAITVAIEDMRTNNKQYRGLILPKDHTQYGSGTTLIKDKTGESRATCSEFIAYHKTKDENGNSITDELTVAHIYNQYKENDKLNAFQTNFNTLKALMDNHTEIGTNTDIYSISTNYPGSLNISSLPTTASTIHIYNNELVGAATEASIEVTLRGNHSFAAAVSETSLQNTPTELLKITGSITDADITSINSFVQGPKILDLSDVTSSITKSMLESLNNSAIEYIILPTDATTKDAVCKANYSSSLTNLKAVISSNESTDANHDLVAYIKVPGSLAAARYYATGGTKSGESYIVAEQNLTTAKLAGYINLDDLSTGDSQKGLYEGANNHTLKKIDLEKAVFKNASGNVDCTLMNFNTAKYADGEKTLSEVILPTDRSMNTIPENCFQNLSTLKEICIPYNYEYILAGAFVGSQVSHITTTDNYDGAVVDNKDKTYTFSANLKQLSSVGGGEVFPENMGVTDIYSLATLVPKCYKNTFPANVRYGFGGLETDMVYCREKYKNTGGNEASKGQFYGVLRFPSKESFTKATVKETIDKSKEDFKTDDPYEQMVKKYTDPYRDYTKKDQTGAVDANGDPILWPHRTEVEISRVEAENNAIWKDYSYTETEEKLEGRVTNTYTESADHYNFTDYIGWHQIVLTQATHVDPVETVTEEKKIVRKYVNAGLFTLCIPFNLTRSQVLKMMGIPKSEGNVISRLVTSNVVSDDVNEGTIQNEDVMPEIYQLTSVERKKKTSTNGLSNNTVQFKLTENLYNSTTGKTSYLNFTGNGEFTPVEAGGSSDDPICIVGGRPYIIRVYKRQGEVIKNQSVGKYILTRYADEMKNTASCVNTSSDFYEQLTPGKTGVAADLITLRFAKPYEKHKVKALDLNTNTDATYNGGKYYYTMVGQFWDQKLPEYSIYMVSGNWYRNTRPMTATNAYTWHAYKCVIMATPEVVTKGSNDGGFRYSTGCNYPVAEEGTADLLKSNFHLAFMGRDDDDFGPAASVRCIYTIGDDSIVEFDENGDEVTAISTLDGEDVAPVSDNGKVYNMAGQFVGSSTEGLRSGLYIVNGKKIVIK